jgi:hypothetical protein
MVFPLMLTLAPATNAFCFEVRSTLRTPLVIVSGLVAEVTVPDPPAAAIKVLTSSQPVPVAFINPSDRAWTFPKSVIPFKLRVGILYTILLDQKFNQTR